jgi:hypothetical protein
MMKVHWRQLQIPISLAVFFTVLAVAAGVSKAAMATASIVVAYFLEFYVLRTVLRLVLTGRVELSAALVGVLAIAISAILVYANFWVILLMATVSMFLFDAIILKFDGVR